ncbi:transcription factor Adf-1-like [Scomber scombrus]|uniref:Transcription factor Adf-1-like n=1 Tax=Scomber scombrus TaxID=13677 RepID=A0AAV1PP51_SCOSC
MEEKLIVAVTLHPALYDTSCPLYRDTYKKEQAWHRVSEVAGLPAQADSDSEPESAAAPPDDAPAVSPSAVPAAAKGRKRARKRAVEEDSSRGQIEALLLETLRNRPPPPSEDLLFLKSLAPSLERLSPQRKAYVKFQMHKLVYEAGTVVLNLEPAE